jgi:hypothetical protein
LRYILAAIASIAVFIIMGFILSPKLGYQNTSVIKLDEVITSLFYNTHSGNIDEFMILLSMYGREIVWSAVIAFLGLFAGWKGKKIAIIIIISFLIINRLFGRRFVPINQTISFLNDLSSSTSKVVRFCR